MGWRVEFFVDDQGRQPAREWLRSLESAKRAAAIAAIETLLTTMGQDVCATEHGKHLGQGLFEFRMRYAEQEAPGRRDRSGAPPAAIVRVARAARARAAPPRLIVKASPTIRRIWC